ncbi:serine/threonine-protein kinase pelle-like isoform X1 [Anopheles cruzii]|uniref:serine/threonine-protein kinase pelle-like isoform X1 n=1 Tax=Anopheles cruzii TaxID=68878 RepID=UPI0022EC7700|nr:serine/threonine-protein kinase pelle-like isoform X1 [Anopheles cruzii]
MPFEQTVAGGMPVASGSVGGPNLSNFVYIYDIPRMTRKRLAALLDPNNKWYDLGTKQMSFTTEVLDGVQRCCSRNNRSPAEDLLEKWGNYNHTITELFVVLSREKLYDCMELIKRYVDPRYHVLIKQSSGGVRGPIGQLGTFSGADANNNAKLMNRGGQPAMNGQALVAEGAAAKDVLPANGNGATTSKENSPFANELTDLTSLIPKISYEELTIATDNWSERNILGKGGFGTVYRGVFKHTFMAIKKIDYNKVKTSEAERIQLQQSFNELRYLNSCRHDNIVALYGYNIDKEPCLVYQFMPGGSLDKCLFARRPPSPLTWKERMNIARGTAKGLQYLHTFSDKPFIHGDIKPGNILLNEYKQPRIGDFGLTRQGAEQNSAMVVSRVYGTRPYIPKEFYDRKELSTKVDTYSFGVVLYEMGTGLRAWDERRTDKHLKDYIARAVHDNMLVAELRDKAVSNDPDGDRCCYNLLMVGHLCTADDPNKRPDMVTVMWQLDKL